MSVLLALWVPLVARGREHASDEAESMRIPVEVVTHGVGSRWMVVEVQQVPEPGAWLLAVLAGVFLLARRRRPAAGN